MTVLVAAPSSPYKGLAPFDDSELDALLFFGRERESEVIAANLIAARLTVLFGPSGVGKSSVLRAGVAHRLRQEEGVEVVVFSAWAGDPVAGLVEACGGEGDSLADALAEAAAHAGGDLYLILDQFEELFLYHRRGGAFAQQLAEVLRRPELRVNVLLGVREDTLARLDVLKAAIPNLLANRLRLERLDRAAGEAATVGPIHRYNELVPGDEAFEIEPGLIDDVLDQVTAGRVELGVAGRGVAAGGAQETRIEAPYLQLVLARLWDVENERGSRILRRASLHELGGAERIVQDHLERAMAALSPREKSAAAAMYNFLVTPSGTKIAHGVHDLAGYAAVDEREASEVLQRLSAQRIVRSSSENGPSTMRYEIFHDVLADAVVGWRTRFEGDRRVEEERQEHHRRQRRLLVFGAVTLLGLAVMAAVAVYALAQRSDAKHQAAVAQSAQVDAEQQKTIADEQTAIAVQNEKVAKQKTIQAQNAQTQAQQSAHQAQVSARLAEAAKLDALSQKALAEGNRRKAERLAVAAASARNAAQKQTVLARAAERNAVHAKQIATRQRKIARARELLASARAVLDQDPEASVRQALAAASAFRDAKLHPEERLENTLRDGLLALRLRAVLPGGGAVALARFSPDGSLALVAGKGGARLFDTRRPYAMRRLGPPAQVVDAAFSPDGRFVAGAEGDHVDIWDTGTGATVATLQLPASALSVAFSPNGRLIATGSADGKARLWSVAGGLLLGTPFDHESGARGNAVRSVVFSPDSSRLLTVGGDRFARIFSVTRSEATRRLNNVVLVNSAVFSHDGKLVATGGSDLVVRTWDLGTGQQEDSFRTTGQTTDLAFSPDDRLLAAAGSIDTTARIWTVSDGDLIGIVSGHRSGVQSVAFSPNSQSLLTTGREGKTFISRSDGGFLQAALLGHQGSVPNAAFSPDGRTVITAGEDGFARLWDAGLDQSGPGPPGVPHDLGRHAGEVNVVAYSPDGKLMLSAGTDGKAHLWPKDGSGLTLDHAASIEAASFSKNSRLVITGSMDGTAGLWRTDGSVVAKLEHGNPVTAARLSPNAKVAATGGRDGWVRLWSVPAGKLLHELKLGAPVNDLRFSPDGKLMVAVGNDGAALLWRVDGTLVTALTGHAGDVVAAAFSPDGRRVATASSDWTARIWDVRTGRSEHTLTGHTAALTALAFSPDGARLVTSSTDRDARVWNVRTGNQIALLRIHSGGVLDVAFSADSRWIATAGPLAAGIWEASKGRNWPTLPIYFVRGNTRPMSSLAFSPSGWHLLMGSKDGSVRTFDCKICGGMNQLTAIARGRLAEIEHVTP
jgi:WD40 repeat protein